MSKLKTELAGAVAISAGILIASGYALTMARLANKGLPTESVLAALPKTYYIGTAVQSVWFPSLVVFTAGTLWFIQIARAEGASLMAWPAWLACSLAVAGYAWGANQLLYREGFHDAPTTFFWVSAACVVGFLAIGLAIRWIADYLLNLNEEPTTKDRDGLALGAVLILCVLAAVTFRVTNVRYLPNAVVRAIVQEDRNACPVAPDQPTPKLGCGEDGYYLGESDKWVYLVLQPPEDHCEAAAFPTAARPNELVQIAKAEIHRVILYKESQPTPPIPGCASE